MEKMENYDPNGISLDNGNYFGFPITPEQAKLVLLSVPWDVTASYGGGTCYGPDAIIEASTQLDLYEALAPEAWREGVGTLPINYGLQEASVLLRREAKKVMRHLRRGGRIGDEVHSRRLEKINQSSEKMNDYVYTTSKEWLERGKLVGLVGGDHSVPLGFMKAIGEREDSFSILHIDAHADQRDCYEGFTYSHASIMFNALERIENIDQLVQVGLRDCSNIEAERMAEHPKIEVFSDYALATGRFEGVTWREQCDQILSKLGERVYVSFDIDGLSVENAPHTGTPVPGGLKFNEAIYLIDQMIKSGRTMVGFDLCEVAPKHDNEWDANVGARVLYKLSNLMLRSRQ